MCGSSNARKPSRELLADVFALTLKSSLILQMLVLHGQMVWVHGLLTDEVADWVIQVQFSELVPPHPSTTA